MNDFNQYLNENGPLVLGDPSDIPTIRKTNKEVVRRTLDKLGSPDEGLEESEINIPVRDGWSSRAFVCRPSPAAKTDPGPMIVLYYGGGFITGAPEGQISNARGFARLFNAVVVCPSYRFAPEHNFPVGVNDAWDVLKWIAANASTLKTDLTKGFIVGGTSAGANFTGVLARRAVEEKIEPKITGQWLAFPVFFNHTGDNVPSAYRDIWTSWNQNTDAPLLNRDAVQIMLGHYEPDYASPLYNPLTTVAPIDMSQLPKALVQVAGMDLVRDDGIVYAYTLESAGVEVRLNAYPGVPHTFWAFVPMLEASKSALVDVAVGMGWLLGKKVEKEEAGRAMLKI